MGAASSAQLKKSRSACDLDWIGPSSSRKDSTKKNRFAVLVLNRCVGNRLPKLQSRRKNRAISRDAQRAFRDLISSWSCAELAGLCAEMESGWAVRELMAVADAARPQTSSLSSDLLFALRNRTATDCFVVFKGTRYALHSLVLRARCRYFAAAWDLGKDETAGDTPSRTRELAFVTESISLELFNAAIHFIYSGEVLSSLSASEHRALGALLNRLGCGSSLQNDLCEFGFDNKGDCTLVFTTSSVAASGGDVGCSRCFDGREYRILCCSGIVAARSDFLRSLIERKRRLGEPLDIVIDEHLIPRIYAPVVLHAIYTDRLDLSKILDGCQVSASSLNEVQAIASGRRQRTPLRHAIDVYHIAKFLNLHRLAHSCEDVMIAELSVDTVAGLWCWASEAGGSAYVRRQCVAFLRAEFSRVAASNLLFELEEGFLHECLSSDFVQASEVEILEALIRWGEHELVRRMEEREPNLVANTTHSISRKGVRRSDLNDQELKNILAVLLPLVRIDYILPPFHQSLNNAYKRGLLDRSPNADLLGQKYPDSRSPDVNPDAHWFDHTVPRRHPSGPRLLLLYITEARSQLRRLCGSGAEVLAEHRRCTGGDRLRQLCEMIRPCVVNMSPEVVIEDLRVQIEKQMQHALRENEYVKKAFSCGCDHHRTQAIEQVRLRILRELNIDESAVEVTCSSPPETSRDSFVPRHYCSQPALAAVSVWPDLTKITISRPDTPQSEYDNETEADSPPDILCTDTAV